MCNNWRLIYAIWRLMHSVSVSIIFDEIVYICHIVVFRPTNKIIHSKILQDSEKKDVTHWTCCDSQIQSHLDIILFIFSDFI